MTFDDYLLELFYLVDTLLEALKSEPGVPRLRSRGPDPVLHDSEVITMELAGEFRGIDTDEGIYDFFRRYHRPEFPGLGSVCRTTFARQAANLWRVKQLLHGRVFALLPAADPLDGQVVWVLDSFPVRVCRFRRAPGHKLFRGLAAYGRDPTDGGRGGRFFGFRAHLRACLLGPCAAAALAPATSPTCRWRGSWRRRGAGWGWATATTGAPTRRPACCADKASWSSHPSARKATTPGRASRSCSRGCGR